MNSSQTFRPCMRVLIQHIMQIMLKQLTRFNRYSSLNFKVHFFKFCTTVQMFQWLMSAAHSVFKQGIYMSTSCNNTQSKSAAKWLHCQWTPVANHSISSMKQSSARQCWSALACVSDSIPALHPIHDNPLAHPSGALTVIFTSESLFNYLFT